MNDYDTFYVDEEKVKSAEALLKSIDVIDAITETFKLLGDPTRLKILMALQQHELCVCDLASLFDVTRSAISHQLRLLKTWRLVKCRRAGKRSYYSLADSHIHGLINLAMEHARE
jgi:DNA-binding transcriptional ArsR family regulator